MARRRIVKLTEFAALPAELTSLCHLASDRLVRQALLPVPCSAQPIWRRIEVATKRALALQSFGMPVGAERRPKTSREPVDAERASASGQCSIVAQKPIVGNSATVGLSPTAAEAFVGEELPPAAI